MTLRFRFATLPDELEQLYALNHRTFAGEIPQHAPNAVGLLVDRFDAENTYIVAMQGDRVVGMVSLRDRRPFSLDAKLPGLDAWLPGGHRVCEVRLLAVEPGMRGTSVMYGLMHHVARVATLLGFDSAVISGAVRQLSLYEHLGFTPFGPRVGGADAPYQPMSCTLAAFRDATARLVGRAPPPFEPVSCLPGPVDLTRAVRAAFARAPQSHRDVPFLAAFDGVRRALCGLTGAEGVALFSGSGTLANDVVAAQLRACGGPGIVLANGEFGERLVDHAQRLRLDARVERAEWGSAFGADAIREIVGRHPDAGWLWMVHHETSTGVLNDLAAAAALGRSRGVRVCADCVSSIGLVPVDLTGVWLASSVSGKALAAPAGLAMVFWTAPPLALADAPRYLDLALHAGTEGVAFTVPSPLVDALAAALPEAAARLATDAARAPTASLRATLQALGLASLRDDTAAAPGIVTVAMADPGAAWELGERLAALGVAASYRSGYLRDRNWIQFALMGECTAHKSALLARLLGHVMKNKRLPTPWRREPFVNVR